MYTGVDAFKAITDRELAKSIFKKSVGRVEIETHSYCNRRCDYCPNVTGDRMGDNKQIKPDHWNMVINNLAEIDYSSNLVLQSYNEPLADRSIINRIKEAKEALPKAQLMIYTNGDYLNKKYLEELAEVGLDYLHVSIHTRHGGKYSEVDSLNLIAKLVKRLECSINYKSLNPGQIIAAVIPHPRIKVEVRAVNYFQNGNTRAGTVEIIKKPPTRTMPCHFPFAHFHMSFNGNVSPCCHIRPDLETNSKFLYGNLDNYNSIFQAWAGEVGAAWRRKMINLMPKDSPCDTCSVGFLSGDTKILQQVKTVWERNIALGLG